jgi:hypothetical protein
MLGFEREVCEILFETLHSRLTPLDVITLPSGDDNFFWSGMGFTELEF